MWFPPFFVAAAMLAASVSFAADRPQPLRVLLLTGGKYHDYAAQKDILKAGLEARANVKIDSIHVDDQSLKPALPIYGHHDYARGYDVVIHDTCATEVSDPAVIKGVLQPHRDGIPAVVLHCGVHSYRIGDPAIAVEGPGTPRSLWFDLLGIQSSGHGPQSPIEITFLDPAHPITKGLANWKTGDEELYNNVKVFDSVHPLARGSQGTGDQIVAWTNHYGAARIFCTTLGHNNATVADPRYLDLVTRGLLWAAGKLDAGGRIVDGYGPNSQ